MKLSKVNDLINLWLFDVKFSVASNTYRDYLNYANHVTDYIGDVDLSVLSSVHIQGMYIDIFDEYGSASVNHLHRVLRIIINYAIDNDYITKNPLKGVKLPQLVRFVPTFLAEAELKRLLHTSEQYGIYNAVLLAGCAGLRRGECLALTTADIDYDRRIIKVTKSAEWHSGVRLISGVKSENSKRLLLVSDKFIQSLVNHTDSVYLCDYSQSVLCRRLDQACKAADLPHIRFHDLRHTFASICVQNGDNLKVLQNRLGHSSIQLTLDTYAHLDITSQEQSARIFDSLID